MIKNIALIVFVVFISICFSKDYNSENKIIIKSKFLKEGFIRYEDSIIVKKINKVNYVNLNIDEPVRVFIRNKKTGNYFFLYLETGKHTIYVDLDNYKISSKTSKICNENAEVLRIKKHFDTIEESYTEIIANQKDTLGVYTKKIDSTHKEYHRAYYNWALAHLSSFISLNFTNFLSKDVFVSISIGITKSEINALFNSLDQSLFDYPTYKLTKEYMEKYINNPEIKIAEPAVPIWNPYQK